MFLESALFINIFLPICIVIAGGLVVWGKMKKTIEVHEDSLEVHEAALDKIEEADYIKRKEHNEYKKSICKKEYIQRREYEGNMDNFCKKIEEVKALVRGMDKKREEARETRHVELTQIATKLGRVEQFMIDVQAQIEKI
jgi:hypothetical protein